MTRPWWLRRYFDLRGIEVCWYEELKVQATLWQGAEQMSGAQPRRSPEESLGKVNVGGLGGLECSQFTVPCILILRTPLSPGHPVGNRA